MKKDPSLKEGLAFEGDKYEGAITAFLTVDARLRRQADNQHDRLRGQRRGAELAA